jgi:hypothetical protein
MGRLPDPARHNGGVMPKTHLLVAFAVLLVGPASAIAGSAEYQSLDAMGLASGKGMKTPCKISGEYEGKTYCFRNEDAKAELMKDAAGNRSKADAYYGSKNPNWTPCDYSETSPNIPDSCD